MTMNIEDNIRSMVDTAVQKALAPFQQALETMNTTSKVLQKLSVALGDVEVMNGAQAAMHRIALGQAGILPAVQQHLVQARKDNGLNRSERSAAELREIHDSLSCAIIGCKKPHRSKGFCATHYQKYRNLEKTNRLPREWVGAPPQSVENFKLPRGAAGHKAVKAARSRALTRKSR